MGDDQVAGLARVDLLGQSHQHLLSHRLVQRRPDQELHARGVGLHRQPVPASKKKELDTFL